MIVVIGGSGRVGGQIVAQLRERNVPVTVVSRGLRPTALRPGTQVVTAEVANPASLEQHVRGASAVFLLWPFTSTEVTVKLAPEVAQVLAGQVPRIVYLSAQPAADRPDSVWGLVERELDASGADVTFLRPTGFAANTLMWADQIRSGDVVRWPFGKAARALIDERDIAAVAVRALTEEGHVGARYALSGPGLLTQAQQVSMIGTAIGRPLRWEEMPREEAEDALTAAWGDREFVASALSTWERFVDEPEPMTTTVADVTGTPAHSFSEWATANAAAFG